MKGLRTLCSIGLLAWLLTGADTGRAAEATLAAPIDFGSIELNPGGDTIVIAAEHGHATPTASRSVITGGGSGRIRLTSADVEHVEILYPDSLVLTAGGRQVVLTDIGPHSQHNGTGVDLLGGGVPVDVHVGGRLDLRNDGSPGNYSGTMSLQFNFY